MADSDDKKERSEISSDDCPIIYAYIRDCANGLLSPQEKKERIAEIYKKTEKNNHPGCSENSLDSYVHTYRCLHQGKRFRNISSLLLEYMISHIYEEEGRDALKTALRALDYKISSQNNIGENSNFIAIRKKYQNYSSYNSDDFLWIQFYKELSYKLLEYKNDRRSLLKIMHQILNEELHLKNLLENEEGISYDTCPFTIYALINRSIHIDTKIAIADALKKHFEINAKAPKVFTGLPEMHYSHIRFFAFGEEPPEIPYLWALFEAAMNYADSPSAEKCGEFKAAYNSTVAAVGSTKWMLPMGLFWIRPDTFLSLDNNNKAFIQKFSITNREIQRINDADQYLSIIEDFKTYLANHPDAPFKNFYEFSAYTYENRDDKPVNVKSCWYLSGKYAELDKTQAFLEKGTWEANFDGRKRPLSEPQYQELIEKVKEGDIVALHIFKQSRQNLPFDTHGKSLNFMRIFATGIVRKNNGDGTLQIDWNKPFDEPKDWYYFIAPGTVWNVHLRKNKENNDLMQDLLNFTFNNIPQDMEKYNRLYQQHYLDKTNSEEEPITMAPYPKNIILYGPPGTGKTYNTINYAVAIIENTPIEDIQHESFADVKERYENYKSRKLIDFVTFHQSYGYDDFIEGIKPVVSQTGQITYEIESGVFKNFCKYATPEEVLELPSEFNIWKVSLKNSKNPKFWDECIRDGCIRVGFEENIPDNSNKGGDLILSCFKTKLQIGDYVISMNSQQQNVVVGRVTGEYEFKDEFEDFKHFRKVLWLGYYDKQEFITRINGGTRFSTPTVYSLKKIQPNLPLLLNNLSKDDSLQNIQSTNENDVFSDKMDDKFQEDAAKPHVFIIDEINRGNVSKIFGELITSIEETKRIGEDEELLVTLPYSKEQFGVPRNVYLLGTMNTADRSLTRIDTALRRRFTFKELMPKSELLADIPDIEGINLEKMLDTMNERIEFLLSREHRIGHAYFLPLKTSHTLDTLKEIFMDKIIPLLQEYFYDDYLKIQLILGDTQDDAETNFIKRLELPEHLFKGAVSDVAEARYVFNSDAFTNPESYRKIYE